jgi:uncharacterized protein YggE
VKEKSGHQKSSTIVPMVAVMMMLMLTSCASPSSSGQTAYGYMDTVTVTGVGEAFGEPDMATVQFGYSASNEDVGTALEQANVAIERISAALIQLGVAEVDIQTTNFSVWPEDQYEPMTGIPTGVKLYRVENTMRVVIREIDSVAEVIQTALDQGTNNVYGLTFGIDDTDAIAAQARSAAVADARVRAEQLVEEMGAQLGEARIASETYGISAFPEMATYAMGLGGGAPSISEGQLSVSVQVNMTFDLLR